ncbi:MAG: hypothetical protein KY468_11865 [Armatimonadetes bacterium]|nr:hypothetical protein [Armatimonadota bacterium]
MDRTDTNTTPVTQQDPHATFTGDVVRVEDDPETMEGATPTHAGDLEVNKLLEEAQVVGGSENTSRPAGGNADSELNQETLDRVANTDTAQEMMENETPAAPGLTST